jgi:hypothetical protein
MIEAYTDYPIEAFGDIPGKLAPIRKCVILTWDKNKYCGVLVHRVDEDGDLRGHITNFKQFYLYKNESPFDGGIQFTDDELDVLPWTEL